MDRSPEQNWRPPSIDALLRAVDGRALVATFGHSAVTDELRAAIAAAREAGGRDDDALLADAAIRLARRRARSVRPVLNLTGSVLHTNLGRAPLAPGAMEAMQAAAGFVNLEYDVAKGRRGQRDDHMAQWLRRLTGADAGIAVNNNAAAVMAVLNALSRGKEAIISRGELVEIGGAFRMPEVMTRAGVKLKEVGATNRTHLHDYEEAISEKTGIIVRVRPSNYAIQGFTSSVPEKDLADLARRAGVPFYDELGAGALVDFSRWGLPKERTVQEALADGADIVSFSGDKLLGGPQAGLIVGRKDLVAKIAKNPLKRAIRLDKVTLAALEATLALYDNPDRLAETLPALRLLSRDAAEIKETAAALRTGLAPVLPGWVVAVAPAQSQIGSGALPVDLLDSVAVTVAPEEPEARGAGRRLERLAAAFRGLPTPVIGRVNEGKLWFDCRCLDDAGDVLSQIEALTPP